MVNRRLFVQFLHPGGEHQPDSFEQPKASGGLPPQGGRRRSLGYDHKDWNKARHQRKFLLSTGRYVSDESPHEGNVVFWCEWEPQSRVVKRYANPVSDGPRFLYEPYYRLPSAMDGLQNTDPFVFGNQFHYAICQQNTDRGSTQLQYLDRGSIILFGSCIDKQRFVVDTVFIVDWWIDYHVGNHTPQIIAAVSGTYLEVTLNPGCNGEDSKGQSRRLYFGATPQKPVHEMYSFFPCLPMEKAPSGFTRPTITLPGLVTSHLTQGRKTTPITGSAHGVELWTEVKAQVEKQGLALGTYARLPEKKS